MNTPRIADPPEPEPDRLDWADPAEVAAWLTRLATAWADAAMVAEDMLRPPRLRDLGPAEHTRLHGDAAASMTQLLAYAGRGDVRGRR